MWSPGPYVAELRTLKGSVRGKVFLNTHMRVLTPLNTVQVKGPHFTSWVSLCENLTALSLSFSLCHGQMRT